MHGQRQGTDETLTQYLARLAIETSSSDLPASAYDAAKRLTLDSLACAIAAVDQPGSREAIRMVREMGGMEEASLLGLGGKVPPPPGCLHQQSAHACSRL